MKRIAMIWVFPGSMIAIILGNTGWMIGPLLAGQVLSWFNGICAVYIIFQQYPRSFWPIFIVMFLIGAKIGQVALHFQTAHTIYFILLNTIFCISGIIVANQNHRLILKQLFVISSINVFLMFLQVEGTHLWTQAIAFENEMAGGIFLEKFVQPALFVKAADISFQVIQARPSGFMGSNNYLSFFAVIALALQMSKMIDRKAKYTLVFISMAVLSMSKMVFASFMLIAIWLIIFGRKPQKQAAIKSVLVFILCMWLYSILFPGYFELQMNYFHITYSIFIRLNDIVDSLPKGFPLYSQIVSFLEGTPRAEWLSEDDYISGYTKVAKYLPIILIILLITFYKFKQIYKKIRNQYTDKMESSESLFLVLLFFPAAVPFWNAQIYWFMWGFVLLPVFLYKGWIPPINKSPKEVSHA